jgi:hypothetical protein
MVTRKAAALLLLAMLVTASCARSRKNRQNAVDEPTIVVVENNNWLETTVYALRSGTRLRLGTVPTGKTLEFTLPAGFTTGASIQLIADPIGTSRTFRSEMLAVGPGRQVQLRVENNLRMSTVSVY